MTDVDLENLSQSELAASLRAHRAEAQRRINDLIRAMGGEQDASPKRGRPPANPLARFGGPVQEPEDEDAASGATQ